MVGMRAWAAAGRQRQTPATNIAKAFRVFIRILLWQYGGRTRGPGYCWILTPVGPGSCALELEKLPQPPRLHPADWNFGVLAVVHAELIAGLKPGHHFLDPVDVHQIRPVRSEERR